MDMTASVDVLSGTSAGGVNAAILGLANARRLDIGSLRDLWLQAGAFDQLLRDPQADPNPPSLLKGDGQLLAALRKGLNALTESNSGPVSVNLARETTVHITTTLLHGQNGQFTDDYGNSVNDAAGGLSVALAEALPQVMAPLDPEMAAWLHQELRANGVALYLTDGVAAFERPAGDEDAAASVVVWQSGTRLPADLVILGLGVRPEVGLARDAGLEIGERGGIRVNEHLQTSDPHIWAVGDAIEVRDASPAPGA